jgi:hypothetical protein
MLKLEDDKDARTRDAMRKAHKIGDVKGDGFQKWKRKAGRGINWSIFAPLETIVRNRTGYII